MTKDELLSHFSKERLIIGIQGLGFVGSAMSIAVSGARDKSGQPRYNVVGVDVPNEAGFRKADSLNDGVFPFENSDQKMADVLKQAAENRNLWATTDVSAFAYADVVVVDINLDIFYDSEEEPYLNLDPFKNAIHSLGEHLREDALVLVETTVPPGTCEKVVLPILEEEYKKRGISSKPHVAHSYERVMPGENYLDSIINFWRVYSGIDDSSAKMAESFLKTVISTEKYPLTRLAKTTATEIAKVLENSYRATTIAFMEEWGRFSEAVDVDIFEVIDAIRMRPTHSNMRQPGFGVGGYCLTKDPYFAKLAAKDLFGLEGMDFSFSSQAVRINKHMPLVSLDMIENELDGVKGKRLLLLGISYRQDVGDTRYSPSEIFAREAIHRGAILDYQDPLVSDWRETGFTVLSEIPDFDGYDAVVFAVQHKEYSEIDFSKYGRNRGSDKLLVFDGNRVLTDEQINQINDNPAIEFHSIGRG